MENLVPKKLAAITLASAAVGGALIYRAPVDEFQGIVQKVFYIHVPAAWVAYLAYSVVLIASIAYLKTRSERWDLLAHGSAEAGVVFTAVCLATGMLWGKPIWGTFWVWDPRLTLTFVLFLIYVGYLSFRSTVADRVRSANVAAVIGIMGFVTVPLVHFSVTWWRGQHPDPIVVDPSAGTHLPTTMLLTMLYMLGVFTLLYCLLLTIRVRLGRNERQAEELVAAEGGSS